MKARTRLRANINQVGLTTALVLALAGCHVGPNYEKPAQWSPKDWRLHGENAAVASRVTDEAPDPDWWNVFHDPELTALERQVATQNLNVRVATARLAESRAQVLIEGANRYPTLGASAAYQREQYSTKELQYAISRVGGNIGSSVGGGLGGQIGPLISSSAGRAVIPQLDMWSDKVDAQYEVDLWGRVARQYEAAKADLEASDEARRGVLIAQEADMARDYMTLRGQQQQLQILEQNRDTQAQTVKVSEDRFHGGLVTELDVASARSQLDSTTAQIAQYRQRIEQQENAIALLLGAPPGALTHELEAGAGVPVVPPVVPTGVPSELAQRRPDIRQAEAQLHAAVANVGEATAEFYPKVMITADFGFQSLSFRDLGFWNARAWNVGPSISLPIFQGGQLRGQLALRRFQQKEAAISYQQTVLGAWHDVDNALIAYRDEQTHRAGLEQAVADQQRALDLARDQYRHGLVTYLNVLSAQGNLLSAQMSLSDSTTTLASNLVQLYNALGGGWESAYPASASVLASTAH